MELSNTGEKAVHQLRVTQAAKDLVRQQVELAMYLVLVLQSLDLRASFQ
ncbi:hypothetical protein SC1_01936 [Sphingopyxis sp. C-1]|nr:hypothetical protein SC1_01936 [Sphingopyxis sp. C-1]